MKILVIRFVKKIARKTDDLYSLVLIHKQISVELIVLNFEKKLDLILFLKLSF